MNDQLSLFHAVISPISKLQDYHRLAVLYLDEDYVRVSCKTSDQSGITCFAELSQKEIFVDHRIESAADNVIVCQVDLVSFRLALQSVMQSRNSGSGKYSHQGDDRTSSGENRRQSALQSLLAGQQAVVFKLAKRNQLPCLCLEGKHTNDQDVDIHQAIPVRIMRRNEMQNHLPPQINYPNVQLELPLDRPIRPVIDKLKAMGQCIILEGTMKGDLTIRLDQDGASLACFYSHLIPRWQDDDEPGGNGLPSTNPNASCILKVDSNKLATCLQWQPTSAISSSSYSSSSFPLTSCLLGMVHNQMLVLHVLLHPEQAGFFTYYLPVHFLQHEEEMGMMTSS